MSDSRDEDNLSYFTVGEGEDDGEGVEGDGAGGDFRLTKRDIHTLNEQRRRDIIKVGCQGSVVNKIPSSIMIVDICPRILICQLNRKLMGCTDSLDPQ